MLYKVFFRGFDKIIFIIKIPELKSSRDLIWGQKIFKVLTYLEEDQEIFEITLNMLENFKTDPVMQPIETLN